MKTRTVIEYIVDVWTDTFTVIEEAYYVEEGVDDLGQMIRKDWGADATYLNVSERRAFTF